MKKILILSHNPVRDRFLDDLLSFELRDKGHVVWVRRYLDNCRDAICAIKPDVVVMPELRCEHSIDYSAALSGWGVHVVTKLCEVGITEDSIPLISEDYRRAIFGNWPFAQNISLMLAWGAKSAELQRKHVPGLADKVVACGGMPFDPYWLPPPPVTRKSSKPVVMFATGFAYADRQTIYSVPEALPNDNLHKDLVEIDRKGRSAWFDMLRAVRPKLIDNYDLVVRLHSGEKQEIYERILGPDWEYDIPDAAVVSLQRVDLLVHAGSTMAFEAHLAKKPAIIYGNVCQDRLVAAISPEAKTPDELVSMIERAQLNKSNAIEATVSALEGYYGPYDGKAASRAAEAIDGLPDTKTSIPESWALPKMVKYLTPDVMVDVQQWVCNACRHPFFIASDRDMVKCPYCGIACVKIS